MTAKEGEKNQDPKAAAAGSSSDPGTQKPEEKTVPLQALKEERDKRQALQSELDNIKVYMQQLQQQQPSQPYPQQQYPQAQPVNTIDQLWETSPKRAVQAELMAAINWYDNMNSQIDRQEISVAQKFPDFNNFRDDVRTYLRTIPISQRTVPGVVEAAYYFVKGQNVDNLIKQSQEQILEKIRKGEAVQGYNMTGSTPPPVQNNPPAPSEDQRKVAAAMGISVEDYMKNLR